jgi:hypothetical protein
VTLDVAKRALDDHRALGLGIAPPRPWDDAALDRFNAALRPSRAEPYPIPWYAPGPWVEMWARDWQRYWKETSKHGPKTQTDSEGFRHGPDRRATPEAAEHEGRAAGV